MLLFYTTDIQHNLAVFHDEEAHHCTQVLRKRVGEVVNFVDGKGWFYEATLIEIAKKQCTLQIVKRWEDPNQPAFQTHIAIAPTKNIERFEWFLEKATEIGISTVTPLLCERSERKQIRLDRLEKIMLAAMKQSLKARLPILHDLMPFNNFIKTQPVDYQKFIAYVSKEPSQHLLNTYQRSNNVIILIGPEGDFSDKEIQQAFNNDYQGVSLGKNRLRTETAGVVACHIVQLKNE
ncbi:MAG: 16S rRNA (uracil(1498)-N(3))-methyltransferase [Saprospiraceae bacterium]